MGRKGAFVVVAAALAFAAATARAGECRGITFPEQIQAAAVSLPLNGLGLRQATVFKVNVYVAALYVPKTSKDANEILGASGPYELVLHFVRSVGTSDINKGWEEGFSRNAAAQLPVLQERIATLTKWMADIKAGERLQFGFTPGRGLQVTVNGVVKGTIDGADFAKAFLSIWLGNPPNPEVKVGMLGGACE